MSEERKNVTDDGESKGYNILRTASEVFSVSEKETRIEQRFISIPQFSSYSIGCEAVLLQACSTLVKLRYNYK